MKKDIPLGKAVIAVKMRGHNCSHRCFFHGMCHWVACTRDKRKDGTDVQFKLIDLPKKEAKKQ